MIGHLAKLNHEQRQVVDTRGHCLAIACPGSGKTSTAASKAACSLAKGNRVVAVTFTKDAALELRERILRLAGDDCSGRLLVGTFHSICLFMAFPGKAGKFGREILADMKSPFTDEWDIVRTGVQYGFVNRALKEHGLNMKAMDALAVIEAAKEARSCEHLDEDMQAMVETYIDIMHRAGKIDFQDIILNTVNALRDGTLTPLAADDLLVDEFQDTDNTQYDWITSHGMAGVPITAVGDDDQSIYGFRRALGYGVMDRFVREFGADRVLLATNYRCRSEILGAAEHLINHNTERITKRLFAERGEGGVVSWESFRDVATESAAVAEEALQALVEGASFAVIAKTNRELIDLQRALLMRDIPFRKADGQSLFDCPEVQTFGALLRSLIKPTANDIDLVLAWAGMKEGELREIRRLFGDTILIGSTKDFGNSKVSEEAKKIWRTFAKRYNEWRQLLEQGCTSLLHMGVHEWLQETLQKPAREYVLQTAADLYNPGEKSLAKHLSDLRKAELLAQKNDKAPSPGEEQRNVVWLLTAHGSKGLEFDRVWIVGVVHGSFPSEKSSVEEERRLMFVAMTRAKDMLWISGTKDKKPSLFVYEAKLLESPAVAAKRVC